MTPTMPAEPTTRPATSDKRTPVLGFALVLLAAGGLMTSSDSATLAFVGGLAMGACLPALFWGLRLSSLYDPDLEVERLATNLVAYPPSRRRRVIGSVYATAVTLSVLAIIVIGDNGHRDAVTRGAALPAAAKQRLPAASPPGGHRASVIANLKSPVAEVKYRGARAALQYYRADERVLAIAEKELEHGYMKTLDRQHTLAMVWICRLLGTSGDARYKPLLLDVATHAPEQSLRQQATKAATSL